MDIINGLHVVKPMAMKSIVWMVNLHAPSLSGCKMRFLLLKRSIRMISSIKSTNMKWQFNPAFQSKWKAIRIQSANSDSYNSNDDNNSNSDQYLNICKCFAVFWPYKLWETVFFAVENRLFPLLWTHFYAFTFRKPAIFMEIN